MITIKSHGFKFGRPDSNVYFDVSYLKNPWRDEDIRNEKDPKKRKEMMVKYMLDQEETELMVKMFCYLLEAYNSNWPDENIQVSFCCSAGEYRSPVVADMVYAKLKKSYQGVSVELKQGPNSKLE